MNKDCIEEEIWIRAWVAVASASNCTNPASPRNWADGCLNAFRERFNKEEEK